MSDIKELLEALKTAKECIYHWHNTHLDPYFTDDLRKTLWDIYNQSPEMKIINDAIAKAEKEGA